ncbi:hypothetical protein V1514DRAFT_274166 [Lipomyces japonicus]|uniref:uncharacterized protein n=1 Tax=Lipomyces japonicus TaxID=56871 RepID=UPI0034CF7312
MTCIIPVLLLILALVVDAKDPKGVHSNKFDPKYKPSGQTLLTPLGNPSLFSFTGRWHRFREVFKASVWPGTYLTVLTFGDYCTLVLKPRIFETTNLTYTISVDDGEPFEVYKVVDLDSVKKGPVYININTTANGFDFEALKSAETPYVPDNRDPHIIKIVSSRRTSPLSFQGIYIPSSVIRQDYAWKQQDQSKPYVEFIGGASHNDQNFALRSAEFKAAESLSFRHAHVTTGDCISSNCTSKTTSLSDQYFLLNPHYRNSYYKRGLTHSGQYAFHVSHIYQLTTPQYLIINVGDEELKQNVNDQKFGDDLYSFLIKLRLDAHPDATILVTIKSGRYDEITTAVIKHLKDPKIISIPFPKKDDERGWRNTLQKYIIPVSSRSQFGTTYNSLVNVAVSTTDAFIIKDNANVASQVIVLFSFLFLFLVLFLVRDILKVLAVSLLSGFGWIPYSRSFKRPARGKSTAWE